MRIHKGSEVLQQQVFRIRPPVRGSQTLMKALEGVCCSKYDPP